MPKPYTFPLLLDEVKTLSISKLKEWQYLEPESYKYGTVTWSRAGEQAGKIKIYSSISDEPFIRLKYKANNEPVDYKIRLVSVPSNLGRGRIWYFVCAVTGKKCRKLYNAGKYFSHREAYPKAMYECQTHSKQCRKIFKAFNMLTRVDELTQELNSKHFKTHYAGKPTKRYKQILNELESMRERQDQVLSMLDSFN